MKQHLPGIIAIYYIECSKLPPHIEQRKVVGMPIGIYEPLTQVCFTGCPTCVTESDYDNHTQIEKTVLTFQSVGELPVRRRLAFAVTDAQQQSYIIGHAEQPFPTIKAVRNFGTPAEDKAGFTYEVTLIGRKTLIEVSI